MLEYFCFHPGGFHDFACLDEFSFFVLNFNQVLDCLCDVTDRKFF